MFTRRAFTFGALGAGAVTLASVPQLASASPVRGKLATELMQLLESYPWAPIGSGAPVYVMVAQNCAVCHAFLRQYPQGVPGIQFRFVVRTTVTEDDNQLMRLFAQRTPRALADYMDDRTNRSRNGITPAMIAMLNRTIPTSSRIGALLATTQRDAVGTPAFVFLPRRNPQAGVQVLPGYRDSYITNIIVPDAI